MNKWIFVFVAGVLGYIAYAGIDVTDKYEDFTDIRDKLLHLGDPLVKDALKRISNSNFDELVDGTVKKLVSG